MSPNHFDLERRQIYCDKLPVKNYVKTVFSELVGTLVWEPGVHFLC